MFKFILDPKRSVNAKLGSGAFGESFMPLGGAATDEKLTIPFISRGARAVKEVVKKLKID